MPVTFADAYALWLTQHGSAGAVGVYVLEFVHSSFGVIRVSDYGEPFLARTETGEEFTATPLGFEIAETGEQLTSEQRCVIRMDNANGAVTAQLRALTLDDLQEYVTVRLRGYLDTDRSAPAYPPVELYLVGVKATRLAVELEVSTEPLPNLQAGLRYTLENFPALAYI